MKIQVVHARNNVTGYGRMATEIIAALKRAGADVVDYEPEDEPAPHILFMTPPQRPDGWFKGQNVSLLTMWESTELALEHLATVPLFNRVFVPSKQNLEMFGKVNPNTKYITLGVNYDEWRYTPRKEGVFTIITGGKGGRRKGIDITIKVFKRFQAKLAEQGYPEARLIIKSDVRMREKRSDVIIIDESTSAEEEVKLYEQAHVGLFLSRGEGWGMIPHQTIAQGIPTILTDAHGHAGFSHLGIGVKWNFCKAETEIVGRTGSWWEASEDDALEALWECFKNYDAYKQVAKLAAESCKKTLTWDHTAQQILDGLPKVSGKITDEWIKCPQTTLLLQVVQPVSCTIGGREFDFKPGQDYRVTADVKRVIYDAGYADEACLDPFEKAKFHTPVSGYIDEGRAA